jgi:energy-coupling factor transporter ATP-binding protein EcfA2
MRLIGVQIKGFRRFGDTVNVRLLESLIAVVGQNEAGKTSFLQALQELNSSDPIADRDRTRGLSEPTEVEATFTLDEGDQEELGSVNGGEGISRCSVLKSQSGDISVQLDPNPDHDLGPRNQTRFGLSSFSDSEVAEKHLDGNVIQEIKNIASLLNSDADYLGDDEIERMEEFRNNLQNTVRNLDADEGEVESIKNAVASLRSIIDHEKNSPPEQARRILRDQYPEFLLFDEDDRGLKETYDLKEHARNPPTPLKNLADLANLDLRNLLETAQRGEVHRRDDLLDDANKELKREFSNAWNTSDVVPDLGVDDTVLHINVRPQSGGRRAPIDQRSEGFRWFLALLAFLNTKEAAENPILLVDEAESHLSYDAQAELIEVLESQDIAQKIIYTTHSAGCLPSDLGRGIRPVIQMEGERSDIKNGFWKEGPGFEPIMGAMGLGPLAFSISRNALIAEGPSETILLPTLIRQSTGQSDLEFQVAPGASNVGEDSLPELLSESGRSVILLDGDESGEERKQALIRAGADSEKVRTYGDFCDEPLIFEDLLDPEAYAEAINEELEVFQGSQDQLTSGDIPDTNRIEAIEEWCEASGVSPPVKSNVCQRLVEKASDGVTVIDSERKYIFRDVHDWARDHFVLMND